MNATPSQRCLGVCWYPEQWPEARWADDVAQMRALGLRRVRIGEFAWSRIEPEPGRFDWAWLDRAVESIAAAGLEVVMGTPTATPPKWLVDRDPAMLAVGLDGRVRGFGSRRHYCFSSQGYLAEAQRITREVAARYGRHPAVVAWQLDNEYGCHDTVLSTSAAARARFRDWLAARYGDIDALNRAWGTAFWSQTLRSFAEAELPTGAVTEPNPAAALDWRRFASDEVLRFNRAMAAIVREHSPGRVLMHNVMLFFTAFDHRGLAADLDVLGWDSYPLGALENFWFDADEKARWLRVGHPDFAAFHHDLYRGMSRQAFWVIEQQPGPVNWGRWNPAPAPGAVRLWTWEALAHGAEMVSWFRWRQAPFAQEQMHAGLQTPDGGWAPAATEARRVAEEIAALPHPPGPRRAAVALVMDYDCLWAVEVQPQGADQSALRQCFESYSNLRQLGLDVDIVGRGDALAGYDLIVLPAQPLVSEALVDELVRALAARPAMQVLLYPRSGSKNEHLSISDGLPPGPLRRLIDLRVTQVESLRPGIEVPLRWRGRRRRGLAWREWIEVGPGVRVEARFGDGLPALVRQGGVQYLAARPDPAFERQWLAAAARAAGLAPVRLPPALRLCRQGALLFAFNHGGTPLTLQVPDARWVLGGPTLEPCGVAAALHQPRKSR